MLKNSRSDCGSYVNWWNMKTDKCMSIQWEMERKQLYYYYAAKYPKEVEAIISLDGTHFIYANNVDRISEITDNLLYKANQ